MTSFEVEAPDLETFHRNWLWSLTVQRYDTLTVKSGVARWFCGVLRVFKCLF